MSFFIYIFPSPSSIYQEWHIDKILWKKILLKLLISGNLIQNVVSLTSSSRGARCTTTSWRNPLSMPAFHAFIYISVVAYERIGDPWISLKGPSATYFRDSPENSFFFLNPSRASVAIARSSFRFVYFLYLRILALKRPSREA